MKEIFLKLDTASQGPCSLDIEINRGDFKPVVEIHDFISDETEDAGTILLELNLICYLVLLLNLKQCLSL